MLVTKFQGPNLKTYIDDILNMCYSQWFHNGKNGFKIGFQCRFGDPAPLLKYKGFFEIFSVYNKKSSTLCT